MLHQIARTVVRRAARNGSRSSSHHPPSDFKPPTMDELPVPQGSWQQYYDQKQKIYNMQLAAGLVIFGATLTFVITSPLMFFNAFPPTPKSE